MPFFSVSIPGLPTNFVVARFFSNRIEKSSKPAKKIVTGGLGLLGMRDCNHWIIEPYGSVPIDTTLYQPYQNSRYPWIRYLSSAVWHGWFSSIDDNEPPFIMGSQEPLASYSELKVSTSDELVLISQMWENRDAKGDVTNWSQLIIELKIQYMTKTHQAKYTSTSKYGQPTTWYTSVTVQWKDGEFLPVIPSIDLFLNSGGPAVLGKYLNFHKLSSVGQLSLQAMKSFTGPVENGLQYMTELAKINEPVSGLIGLLGKKLTAKSLASAYLSYEYGLRLTAKDTYSYLAKMTRQSKRMGEYSKVHAREFYSFGNDMFRASGYQVLTGYHWNIDTFVTKTSEILRRNGFMPSTQIAWDFVPFSFIVDWFTPIGEALECFDSRGIYATYEWIQHIYTRKDIMLVDSSLISTGVSGKLRITHYSRKVSPGMPKPEFDFDSINLSNRQIRNGIAIALQRWK